MGPADFSTVLRRPVFFLALIVFAGLAGYGLTRHFLPEPATDQAARHRWLREEFGLDAEQVARVDALRAEYAPVCAAHCSAITEARANLDAAPDGVARAAALAELERLKKVCADATRAHLQAVAACMAPPEGARFLALMEPHIAHGDTRSGAPALDGRP